MGRDVDTEGAILLALGRIRRELDALAAAVVALAVIVVLQAGRRGRGEL